MATSKNISIEDILNASDSDYEDTGTENIDLELLLEHEGDGDQDSEHIDYGNDKGFTDNKSIDMYRDFENQLLQLKSLNNMNFDSAEEAASEKKEESATVDALAEIVMMETEDLESHPLDALSMADLREQRFLKAGSRETVSALKAKRNAHVVSSYSNVKCEQVKAVSSQLQRNANYKQHGPGAASSLHVSDKFIAVGTTKGLAILFDRNEEIRQVLGSSVPTTVRPQSTLTAMDSTPKGDVLLCGHATGEVALWDVPRGALLKTVSDTHSTAILQVSFVRALGEEASVSLLGKLTAGFFAEDSPSPGPAGTHSPVSNNSLLVAVTLDRQGRMQRIRFSKTLWTSYSVELECLLDGSSGFVYDLAALSPFRPPKGTAAHSPVPSLPLTKQTTHSTIKGTATPALTHFSAFAQLFPTFQLIAFSFLLQTCIVQVAPTVEIVHRWNLDVTQQTNNATEKDSDKGGQGEVGTDAPLLDWTWLRQAVEVPGEEKIDIFNLTPNSALRSALKEDFLPVLARACGSDVSLLLVKPTVAAYSRLAALPVNAENAVNLHSFSSAFNFSGSARSPAPTTGEPLGRSALEFQVVKSAHFKGHSFKAMHWMQNGQLVLLSRDNVLILSSSLLCTETASLEPLVVTGFDDIAKALTPLWSPLLGQYVPHPCSLPVAVHESRLFVCFLDQMFHVQVQSCFELADFLISNGQWLEALAHVLEKLQRSPALLDSHAAEVAKYIVRYVELAVKQSPLASTAYSHSSSTSSHTKNHHHLVAGVCIEFCVDSRRLDLLFGILFDVFTSARQQTVFLESLEPFILARAIHTLPPKIIAEFFQYSLEAGRLATIERCVAYFDVECLDLNLITRFLYDHRMVSSFLYVYSNGLGDFTGAFQLVFVFLERPSVAASAGDSISGATTSSEVSTAMSGSREPDLDTGKVDPGFPSPEQADIAYKLLLFLSYTSDRKIFPRGDEWREQLTEHHLAVSELLQLLIERQLRPVPTILTLESGSTPTGAQSSLWKDKQFPYLSCLAMVDAEALLVCMLRGMEVLQSRLLRLQSDARYSRLHSAVGSSVDDVAQLAAVETSISSVLDHLAEFSALMDAQHHLALKLTNLFFRKFSDIIISCTCPLSMSFITQFVAHCHTSSGGRRYTVEQSLSTMSVRQSKFMAEPERLRAVLRKNQFWLAALSIKKPSLAGAAIQAEREREAKALDQALSFYVTYSPEERSAEGKWSDLIFVFIETHFSLANDADLQQTTTGSQWRELLEGAVAKVLPRLCRIDVERTRTLCRSHLSGCVEVIADSCRADPQAQFQCLHAVASSLEEEDTRVRLLEELFPPKLLLVYIGLLSTFRPEKVLPFLRTYEGVYPLQECLGICQSRAISDACSFLLERSGDDSAALNALLKDFSQKIKAARRDVDAQLRVDISRQAMAAIGTSGSAPETEDNERLSPAFERSAVSHILSKQGAARSEAARQLPMYEMLLNILHCACDLCERHSSNSTTGMWFSVFDHLLAERQHFRTGTMSSAAEVVVVLIGVLLQELMLRMRGGGRIPSQAIVRRISGGAGAAGIRLGEFRDVLLSMLDSGLYDHSLYRTVGDILSQDLVALQRQKIMLVRKPTLHKPDTSPTELDSGVHESKTDSPHFTAIRKRARYNPTRPKQLPFKFIPDSNGVGPICIPLATSLPTSLGEMFLGGDQDDAQDSYRPGSLPVQPAYYAALPEDTIVDF